MSTIRVRRLDENWDPAYGSGKDDYIYDLDAVMQIIQSRLRLWLAEWWEDLNEGLPMWQKILGVLGTNKAVADRLIQARIASSPYVISVTSFVSTFDVSTRAYQCVAVVDTQWGPVTVTNGG
jgi:hypothetical protein